MKRFDLSVEISKQLISICSAAVFGLAAFTGSIFVNENQIVVYSFILAVFLFLVLSICAGIIQVGAMVNLVETVEKKEKEMSKADFVSVFDSAIARYSSIVQQLTSLLAFILLGAALIVDRIVEQVSECSVKIIGYCLLG